MAELSAPADHDIVPPPGCNAGLLAEALRLARAHETPWPRDLRSHIEAGHFEAPPHNAILGPVIPRGVPNGLVTYHGQAIARWGDTRRIDMTFSVAKSYLAILAGVAVADGLIPDLDARVAETLDDGGFTSAQNGPVTWRHLLQNTSEWEGTLFGKSDIIDRGRDIGVEGRGRKGDPRPLQAPGTHWEYNDVRVNRLALSLMQCFGRGLPEIFAERIMCPIGASTDWSWHGYDNSWIDLPNKGLVHSVSGGGHWGGGVFIHAEDQALIGQLVLQDGVWNGRRLLPAAWVAQCRVPCALNARYGLLWWLNTGGLSFPSASHESFAFSGAGGHTTWMDPTRGLVAVTRWLDPARRDQVLGLLSAAVPMGHG